MENKKKSDAVWVIIDILLLILIVAGIVMMVSLSGDYKVAKSWNDSKLVLYEGPKSLKDATAEDIESVPENQRDFRLMHCTDTKVSVNGYDCYVYDTNVNHSRSWESSYYPNQARTPITYFDFEGKAEITVTVPDIDLQSVQVSPLSSKIEAEVDAANHQVSFTITEPGNYTVTFNDSVVRALHIFANDIEKDVPDFDDENVLYVGPGEWDIDTINLESGQTLYVSGGAVIHGTVNCSFVDNVKVMGRGIIDGSQYEGWKGKVAHIALQFDNCKDITTQDIILLNPNAWVCQGYETENGLIDGIRIISSRPNGDGITLQSCRNMEVKDCFVRSWDDSLVVKNYMGNSESINFHDIQLWTDLAQSMEIGYETNKGKHPHSFIKDITFENITVLHNFHKPVVSVHNADDATVEDILFKNIVVEDAEMGSGDGSEAPYLIDMNIALNGNWSTTKERGQIKNVTIDGLTVLSGRECPSRIHGYDAEHIVDGVTIKNLNVLGKDIKDFTEGGFDIDEETTANLSIE